MTFEELKQRQSTAWGAAPFENVEDSLAAMHDDLVARLDPQRGETWLDLACGAGAVALRAAQAGAEVTGVDFSPVMVETARRRAAAQGLSITFDVGDVENLPYPDASFPVVSSSVGFFLAPDQAAVAGELARVVAPGGRLGFTAWCPGGRVERGMKLSGRFQPPPPEGVGNPFDWGTEARVTELLGDAFELEFHEGDAPDRGESGEAIWEYLLAGVGPMRTLYHSLEPERREEFHQAAVAMYEEDRVGDEVVLPGPYLLTIGRRR